VLFIAAAFAACGCERRPSGGSTKTRGPSTVSVAALQFHSVMGDVEGNLRRIEALVERAAGRGARVCVLPECAVPGYADLGTDLFWSTREEKGYLPVRRVAETVPGPTTRRLGRLADRLGIYLTAPLIEKATEQGTERFYNAAILLGPDGSIRGHYRKRIPWTVADTYWMTEGPERVCVVDTEYGRLGLMICRDVHRVLRELGEARADIVLHCVAWYGPNSDGWFGMVLSRMVREAGVTLVLANWTFPADPGWSGYGLSRVIGPDGSTMARCAGDLGDQVVMVKVPVASRAPAP
jgi:predicted amidohydrolase